MYIKEHGIFLYCAMFFALNENKSYNTKYKKVKIKVNNSGDDILEKYSYY